VGKTFLNIFALFLQLSEIPGLSGGVNRFCKSPLFTLIAQACYIITYRQTDRRKSDPNSGAYTAYNAH